MAVSDFQQFLWWFQCVENNCSHKVNKVISAFFHSNHWNSVCIPIGVSKMVAWHFSMVVLDHYNKKPTDCNQSKLQDFKKPYCLCLLLSLIILIKEYLIPPWETSLLGKFLSSSFLLSNVQIWQSKVPRKQSKWLYIYKSATCTLKWFKEDF